MLGVSAVITFAIMLFLTVSSSVNMPTAAVVPLFSVNMPTAVISVLVRTFISVLVQTLATPSLPVFVQATVPAFEHTVDYFLALVRDFVKNHGRGHSGRVEGHPGVPDMRGECSHEGEEVVYGVLDGRDSGLYKDRERGGGEGPYEDRDKGQYEDGDDNGQHGNREEGNYGSGRHINRGGDSEEQHYGQGDYSGYTEHDGQQT